MRLAAKLVATELARIGMKQARVIKTAGQPLVYAEWLEAPDKPTVLLYGHYDVQPIDPIELWTSAPFEPEIRDENLYARGAVDDKGQMYALVKALEALMHAGQGTLPVNVRVLIEGEEECGGEAIEAYVLEHPRQLASDVALVADTGMPAPGLRPAEVLPWLERRVEELCPPGVRMRVSSVHGGDAVLVPLDNPFMRAAERALEQEWDRAPVFERSGGSIPVGALFDSVLQVPVIFMGTGLPDDNVHAPNEKYHVPNFYHLIRQAIRFLAIVRSDPAILSRPSHATANRRKRDAPTAARA